MNPCRLLVCPLLLFLLAFSSCTNAPNIFSPANVQATAFAAATTAAPFLSTQEKADVTAVRTALQQGASGTLTPQVLMQIIATFRPTTKQGIFLSLGLLALAEGYTALYSANSTNPNVVVLTQYVNAVATGLQTAGFASMHARFSAIELRRMAVPLHPPTSN